MSSATRTALTDIISQLAEQEADIRLGGGQAAIERQHKKKRLTARERIEKLIDPGTTFFELGLWAAWGMYEQWGAAPAAGDSLSGWANGARDVRCGLEDHSRPRRGLGHLRRRSV